MIRTGKELGEISIHAPLAGRDGWSAEIPITYTEFQSTRPLRGATKRAFERVKVPLISIHAPLAGRDGRAAI